MTTGVRSGALQNASPTCLNSRHLTSPRWIRCLSHSDRFVQSGQTVSKLPPPNVGKRCISMYQCRRKWLKRNLRTSSPSMTRTQAVFCFSRRTRECCTDLVPGKRRKPSRNYKNWRLWRRLWIFFGRWIPLLWICRTWDRTKIDWWVSVGWNGILFAFTCKCNSSAPLWWDCELPKMVFVPRFCTSFGGCWTPSSRFCDAFPYSGTLLGGLVWWFFNCQVPGGNHSDAAFKEVVEFRRICWCKESVRENYNYYKLRHLERSAQNCNNDGVGTCNICNVLKLQCSEESVPRKRKEQWVRFLPHLKRMTRKDMFGSVYKKPLGVS